MVIVQPKPKETGLRELMKEAMVQEVSQDKEVFHFNLMFYTRNFEVVY